MDPTSKVMARLSGVILLVAGPRSWRSCGTIGLRLTFDRPNRYQSLLPPFGWYAMGSVFVLLGLGLGVVVIHQGDYEQLVGAACAILVAFWCWKAGRNATTRGRSDAHAS